MRNGKASGLEYPLHPIDDCPRSPQDDILDVALSDDLCLNIAVTGGYGAGKSSFLRSYFKRLHKKSSPIWISLLDFCEIHHDGKNAEKFASRLEIDILQHILYSCKQDDVSYSRVMRPDRLTIVRAVIICLYWLSWIFCVGLILDWKSVSDLIIRSNALNNIFFVSTCSFFVSWLLVPLIVWGTIWFRTRGLSAKISLYGAEVDVSSASAVSPVNMALCELICFFADTHKTIVVFEDIDRFRSRRIFTKLREACIAINRSPLIRRRVRFIYCVRDDIFEACEERTKFFDCIIPIIPYVNFHNARALFANYMRKVFNVDHIPSKINVVLNALSRFIVDARTLNNICLEFKVHRNTLNYAGNDDGVLLGLIVFKNLLPKEYGGLANEDCAFRRIIALKNNIVSKKCASIQTMINAAEVSFSDWLKSNSPDCIKEVLPKDKMASFRKTKVEKQSNISNLKVDLEKMRSTPLIKLVHQDEIQLSDIVSCFPKGSERWKAELLYTLIDIGCLSEYYMEYISLFHEGYLSASDKRFVVNALSYKRNEWDMTLSAPASVLGALPSRCFSHASVLNFSLLSFILRNSKSYMDKLALMMNMLGRLAGDKGLEFIDAYLTNVKDPRLAGMLALFLIKNWPEYQESLLSIDSKNVRFKIRQVAGLLKAARIASDSVALIPAVWSFLDDLQDISLLWGMDTCTKDDVKLAIAKFHFKFSNCSDMNLKTSGLYNEVVAAREYMRKKRGFV